MKSIPGYIDITSADFREIYGFTYRHAFERLDRFVTAPAVTAGVYTTIYELSRIMKDHLINRIPIVDDEKKIAGIVSRGDLVDLFCADIF